MRLDSFSPSPKITKTKENESNGQTRKLLSHLPMRQMASMLKIIMSSAIIEAFSNNLSFLDFWVAKFFFFWWVWVV